MTHPDIGDRLHLVKLLLSLGANPDQVYEGRKLDELPTATIEMKYWFKRARAPEVRQWFVPTVTKQLRKCAEKTGIPGLVNLREVLFQMPDQRIASEAIFREVLRWAKLAACGQGDGLSLLFAGHRGFPKTQMPHTLAKVLGIGICEVSFVGAVHDASVFSQPGALSEDSQLESFCADLMNAKKDDPLVVYIPSANRNFNAIPTRPKHIRIFTTGEEGATEVSGSENLAWDYTDIDVKFRSAMRAKCPSFLDSISAVVPFCDEMEVLLSEEIEKQCLNFPCVCESAEIEFANASDRVAALQMVRKDMDRCAADYTDRRGSAAMHVRKRIFDPATENFFLTGCGSVVSCDGSRLMVEPVLSEVKSGVSEVSAEADSASIRSTAFENANVIDATQLEDIVVCSDGDVSGISARRAPSEKDDGASEKDDAHGASEKADAHGASEKDEAHGAHEKELDSTADHVAEQPETGSGDGGNTEAEVVGACTADTDAHESAQGESGASGEDGNGDSPDSENKALSEAHVDRFYIGSERSNDPDSELGGSTASWPETSPSLVLGGDAAGCRLDDDVPGSCDGSSRDRCASDSRVSFAGNPDNAVPGSMDAGHFVDIIRAARRWSNDQPESAFIRVILTYVMGTVPTFTGDIPAMKRFIGVIPTRIAIEILREIRREVTSDESRTKQLHEENTDDRQNF